VFWLRAVKEPGREAHNQFFGAPFAMPAMGEKGYLDIKVSCLHTKQELRSCQITVGTAGGVSYCRAITRRD